MFIDRNRTRYIDRTNINSNHNIVRAIKWLVQYCKNEIRERRRKWTSAASSSREWSLKPCQVWIPIRQDYFIHGHSIHILWNTFTCSIHTIRKEIILYIKMNTGRTFLLFFLWKSNLQCNFVCSFVRVPALWLDHRFQDCNTKGTQSESVPSTQYVQMSVVEIVNIILNCSTRL